MYINVWICTCIGLAGVVTKPILGVTDGIASVVHGISNQVSDVIVISTVRPPRAFNRSETDVCERVLVPVDLAAAYAQEYVLKIARRGGYADSFISHISIDGSVFGSFTSSLLSAQNPNTSSKDISSHSQKSASGTYTYVIMYLYLYPCMHMYICIFLYV